jgi:hypothetical protein
MSREHVDNDPASCFLCGNHRFRPRRSETRAWVVGCELCGRYAIYPDLASDITENRNSYSDLLPYLTAYARQFNVWHSIDAGTSDRLLPLLAKDNFRAYAAGHRATTVRTKLRRVLERIRDEARVPGYHVKFDNDLYPVFDCADREEFNSLLELLVERGDVKQVVQLKKIAV